MYPVNLSFSRVRLRFVCPYTGLYGTEKTRILAYLTLRLVNCFHYIILSLCSLESLRALVFSRLQIIASTDQNLLAHPYNDIFPEFFTY